MRSIGHNTRSFLAIPLTVRISQIPHMIFPATNQAVYLLVQYLSRKSDIATDIIIDFQSYFHRTPWLFTSSFNIYFSSPQFDSEHFRPLQHTDSRVFKSCSQRRVLSSMLWNEAFFRIFNPLISASESSNDCRFPRAVSVYAGPRNVEQLHVWSLSAMISTEIKATERCLGSRGG